MANYIGGEPNGPSPDSTAAAGNTIGRYNGHSVPTASTHNDKEALTAARDVIPRQANDSR